MKPASASDVPARPVRCVPAYANASALVYEHCPAASDVERAAVIHRDCIVKSLEEELAKLRADPTPEDAERADVIAKMLTTRVIAHMHPFAANVFTGSRIRALYEMGHEYNDVFFAWGDAMKSAGLETTPDGLRGIHRCLRDGVVFDICVAQLFTNQFLVELNIMTPGVDADELWAKVFRSIQSQPEMKRFKTVAIDYPVATMGGTPNLDKISFAVAKET